MPCVAPTGLLAIQEFEWKKKKRELERRRAVIPSLIQQARVLDTRVQTASKKLKERLRTLSYVFAVRLGSVSRVRGVSLVVAGSNSLSVSCSSYGIVSEWHVAGLGHARHR
jgi:hypothetical protein